MWLWIACTLSGGSGAPVGAQDPSRTDPLAEDSGDPTSVDTATPVEPEPFTVELLTGASCENPCTFSARMTGDVASLRYEADGWVLGEVPAASPELTYTFSQLGERDVRVVALDAAGAERAEDHSVVQVSAPPSEGGMGAWLWYVDGIGMSHAELADRLAGLGARRVYVKVADGAADCGAWPELCDATVPATYQAAGLEAWAWAYVYPGSASAQADALSTAARTGYDGYVLDIESEFDGASSTLETVLVAFAAARDAARADGTVGADWELRATTWGNPGDHGMRVDILDRYVDAHLPQTYVEVWGSSYMADAAWWVELGTCEYRSLGATKPIHHIVSTEYDEITAAQIDDFVRMSGPETSIWRVPGGGTSTRIWDDWAAVDWAPTSFDEPDCR